VAFSPDGRTALTGSGDKTARLWDVSSGKPLATLQHEDGVSAVAFSPDGRTALTGSDDTTARLWDVASGKPLATLQHEGRVWSVEFSRDGRSALTGSRDGTARLWEIIGPAPDEPSRLRAWVRRRTAKSFDDGGAIRELTADEWLKAVRQLETSGGDWQRPRDAASWHRVQASEAEVTQFSFAAVFHLSQLLKETPDDLDLHLRLARAKLGLRSWQEAVTEATQVLDRRPNDDTALAYRGSAFAELGRWKEAIVDLETCSRLKPDARESWYRLGLARLVTADEANFRDVCRRMLERFRANHDAELAGTLACLAGLVPNSGLPPETLVTLAETANAACPSNEDYLLGLGNAQFRSGRYTEARTCLGKAVNSRKDGYRPDMGLVLAMVNYRVAEQTDPAAIAGLLAGPHGPLMVASVSHPEASVARAWLRWADSVLLSEENVSWDRRVMRRVLRAEAGRLLGVGPPAQATPR
jgi:Flp pilus assembly protein TadD